MSKVDFRVLILSPDAESARKLRSVAYLNSTPELEKSDQQNEDLASSLDEAVRYIGNSLRTNKKFSVCIINKPDENVVSEEIQKIWKADSDIQILIRSSSQGKIRNKLQKALGAVDNLIILNNDSDVFDVRSCVLTLVRKWKIYALLRSKVLEMSKLRTEFEDIQKRNEAHEDQTAELENLREQVADFDKKMQLLRDTETHSNQEIRTLRNNIREERDRNDELKRRLFDKDAHIKKMKSQLSEQLRDTVTLKTTLMENSKQMKEMERLRVQDFQKACNLEKVVQQLQSTIKKMPVNAANR